MEGVLDIWEGILNGWRSHFVTLFADSLIICQNKGGQVRFKIQIADTRIDTKSEKETKFSVASGPNSWDFNAKDIRDKIKWISAM